MSEYSLQAGPVSLSDRPLDHSVPPLSHIEWLQSQESQKHPQVFDTVLDRSTYTHTYTHRVNKNILKTRIWSQSNDVKRGLCVCLKPGVPERIQRRLAFRSSTALLICAFGFLMMCPSSSTTLSQLMPWRGLLFWKSERTKAILTWTEKCPDLVQDKDPFTFHWLRSAK